MDVEGTHNLIHFDGPQTSPDTQNIREFRNVILVGGLDVEQTLDVGVELVAQAGTSPSPCTINHYSLTQVNLAGDLCSVSPNLSGTHCSSFAVVRARCRRRQHFHQRGPFSRHRCPFQHLPLPLLEALRTGWCHQILIEHLCTPRSNHIIKLVILVERPQIQVILHLLSLLVNLNVDDTGVLFRLWWS